MSISQRRLAIVAGFWMLSFLLSWATAVRADPAPGAGLLMAAGATRAATAARND